MISKKILKSLIVGLMVMTLFVFSACNSSVDDSQDMVEECTEEIKGEPDPEGRGENIEPLVFTTGEFAGQYDPADIRGSFTLQDISRYFEIPLADLSLAFNIPLEEADFFENRYYKSFFEGLIGSGKSIGNGSMMVFVSMYKGIPFIINEPEYLLETAADVLRGLGTLSDSDLAYLNNHVVSLEEARPIPISSFVPPEKYDDEYRIYGRTTFGDLLRFGLSQEQISKIIGADMPGENITIKDYCVLNGLFFSEDVKPDIYDILYTLVD